MAALTMRSMDDSLFLLALDRPLYLPSCTWYHHIFAGVRYYKIVFYMVPLILSLFYVGIATEEQGPMVSQIQQYCQYPSNCEKGESSSIENDKVDSLIDYLIIAIWMGIYLCDSSSISN